MRQFTRLAFIMLCIALLGIPATADSPHIALQGSDTMLILGQRLAEAFQKKANIQVSVSGGGSSVGIAALVNGTITIAEASRPIDTSETRKLRDVYGDRLKEIPIAKDGISVVVHSENPVNALTLEQLHKIFTGTATNWQEFGGADAPIILYGRETSSGTYRIFQRDVLLGDQYSAKLSAMPGTAAIVNAIANDKNGIGYSGVAYAKGVKICALKRCDTCIAVLPSKETVLSGTYPLSRTLFWYTPFASDSLVAQFVSFVDSEDGQKIIEAVGYYSMK